MSFPLSNCSYEGLTNSAITAIDTQLAKCSDCGKNTTNLVPKCAPRGAMHEKATREQAKMENPNPGSVRRPNKKVLVHCHVVCRECFLTYNHNKKAVNTEDGPVCLTCDTEFKGGLREAEMRFAPVHRLK